MGHVVVLAEQHIDAPADSVFALFGQTSGAGWLFGATCDRLVAGGVVTLQLPIGGPDGQEVAILGRFASIEASRRIEIVHHLPWRGRMRLLFADESGGDGQPGATRVRLVADLDGAGVAWLLRHRGFGLTETLEPDARPIGLLLSKSGPGSVFAGACEELASMAVGEVNADGGIDGRPIHLLVGDDATDPWTGAIEARRLVNAGCRTIFAATTSSTFARVGQQLGDEEVLLVHTVMNEGGSGGQLRMQFGERPNDQLATAVEPVMRAVDGRRWFLAGNDYVWPRVVHAAARRVLEVHRAQVLGEGLVPLGTRDFGPLIERIMASGAEVILSSFVGADLVGFERQCHDAGVKERCVSLALALDEPTRERIGDAAAQGMWGVSGYFAQLEGPSNSGFLARYRASHGPLAPPVSSISEATYEAVHLYAEAARGIREDDPRALARVLRRSRATFARGEVAVTGPETVVQDLFVARAVPGGFVVQPPH